MQNKEAVNYRQGDETANCQMCMHFKADGTCALVEGKIFPEGLCDLYEPLDAATETEGLDEFLFGA